MKKLGILASLALCCTILCAQPSAQELSHLKETNVSNADLLKWRFTGIGKIYDESGRQLCMQEGDDSQGVGIFSPESYRGDVVLRYKVMPLNAATVLVALLCMSDEGPSLDLTLPEDYNGSMGPILAKENYFIAFRNSPHATAPFICKDPKFNRLIIAQRDEMLPGVYYDVEVGRLGEQIWLKIDGKTVVKCTDPTVLQGGHLGVRIRGLVGHPAVCLLRDLSVLSAQ